ncbi:MAG: PAS domain S-box protein [Pseudomonadota bacterium]
MKDTDNGRADEPASLRDRIAVNEEGAAPALPHGMGSVEAGEASPQAPHQHAAAWAGHVEPERTTRLLKAMNAAQDRFISNGDPKDLFNGLLTALLSVTESEYGFIDEVHRSDDGTLYRHVRAITNIAWNEATRARYERLSDEEFKFHNLNTLTGAVVTGGRPVISNDPADDPRSGGLPPGHPAIHSFLGLPLISGGTLVGIVGAANRVGGYSQQLADFLKPYLNTCANIIMAYRNEQRRKDAEEALRQERERLEKRVEERTADLRNTNEMLQQEIAERRRIAQALVESEIRYRTVFENAGDAIFLMEYGGEHAGRILSANRTAARIHGYTVEELVGMNMRSLDTGLSRDRMRHIHELFEEGGICKTEADHVRKDGTVFPVEVCAALIELGNKKYVLSNDRDITDRKLAEKALRESERKYREFAEFLPQIVFELDERGDLTFINRAGLEIGGYSREELEAGLKIMQLFSPGDRGNAAHDIARAMRGESVPGVEHLGLKKNGTIFPLVTYLSPITRHGRIQGVRAMAVDISELKQAMEESRQLRIEAETANRAKSEFLANMSHELRTPLNAVIGFSEVLEDRIFGPLNKTQSDYVGHIISGGRHLLRLIDDLLDVAAIESGRMKLHLGEVSVPAILRGSLAMMKETLETRSLRSELCIAHSLMNAFVTADEVRLRQVLLNLISNAAKFTPDEGGVQIRAGRSKDELLVTVTDTGIGIDPGDQRRIFNTFERVDGSSAGLRSGTGLGLALTRNLVEMHGGRIWVESKGQGQGSSFTFTLPMCGSGSSANEFLADSEWDNGTNAAAGRLGDSRLQLRVFREEEEPSGS